jgi:hypothetical protein
VSLVPGEQAGRVWWQATAGRDANQCGPDLFIINIGAAGSAELVVRGLLP